MIGSIVRVRPFLFVIAVMFATATQGVSQKRPRDQREYELITAVYKETADANKKLQLLGEWEKRYPETAYSTERVQAFMAAHQQAGHAKETLEYAKKESPDSPLKVAALA